MGKDFEYIDRVSILLLLFLAIITALISGFMFYLGGIGYLIALLFCAGFIRQINHVVAFRNYFWIVKHIILIKKVRIEDVYELKCELTGMGRSRDITIYLYYYERKIEKIYFFAFQNNRL